MRGRRLFGVVLVALLPVSLANCSEGRDRPLGPSASASSAYPHETLRDWVSYGDAVVVFEVTDEEEIPPLKEEVEAGEGLIFRSMTARVLDVLWSAVPRTSVPAELHFVSYGWVFDGDERREMGPAGSGRIEVGERYLAAVTPDDDGSWMPLSHEDVMRWDDERAVAAGERASDVGDPVELLDGLSSRQIAALLDEQEPIALIDDRRDLTARERWALVADESTPTQDD